MGPRMAPRTKHLSNGASMRIIFGARDDKCKIAEYEHMFGGISNKDVYPDMAYEMGLDLLEVAFTGEVISTSEQCMRGSVAVNACVRLPTWTSENHTRGTSRNQWGHPKSSETQNSL